MPKVPSKAPKEAAPAPVVREYKLLVGQHVGPDLTEEPVVRKDPISGVETRKWPSRTYAAGETVPSEMDLVARFGAEKFQYLGDPHPDSVYFGTGSPTPGDPTPFNTAKNPTIFPHGQVASGYPTALSTEGPVKEGPASETTLKEIQEQAEASYQENANREEHAAETTEEDKPTHGRRGRRG